MRLGRLQESAQLSQDRTGSLGPQGLIWDGWGVGERPVSSLEFWHPRGRIEEVLVQIGSDRNVVHTVHPTPCVLVRLYTKVVNKASLAS